MVANINIINKILFDLIIKYKNRLQTINKQCLQKKKLLKVC